MLKENCIFCKISKKEIASKIIYEDNTVIAFEDINPQAPVHVVIISKNHFERLSDLSDGDAPLIGNMIMAARKIAKEKGIEGTGYRVVANCGRDGGQAVFHLHLHLLGGRTMAWPPG